MGKRVGIFNSVHSYPDTMKVRIPRLLAPVLTPRRKYEVNESMWLVRFGRPKVVLLMRFGRMTMVELDSARKRIQPQLVKAMNHGNNSVRQGLARQGRNAVLWFQWGKIPEDWELSFVSKMKFAEGQGVTFREVLKADLPVVIGEAPSRVLLRWVGRNNVREPKKFLEEVEEMFGPSGKRIIIGLQSVLDPEKMLEERVEPEVKFQSLIDAIRHADEKKEFAEELLEEVPSRQSTDNL